MKITEYDRAAAASYAKQWAFKRNPEYYNFDFIGGDCTNFVSQCVFAGAKVMNYTPDTGWFYVSPSNRAAAWTSVEYFYKFLTENSGEGPFGEAVNANDISVGDAVQLGRATGDFYHTAIITGFTGEQPLITSHTNDAYNRPLGSYYFEAVRFIRINGVRS